MRLDRDYPPELILSTVREASYPVTVSQILTAIGEESTYCGRARARQLCYRRLRDLEERGLVHKIRERRNVVYWRVIP